MADTSVVSVECLGKSYLFNINHNHCLPVGWLVSETLRLYYLGIERPSLITQRFAGVVNRNKNTIHKLELSTILSKEMCFTFSKVAILHEGPYGYLPRVALTLVAQYVGLTVRNISRLQRVCKKYQSMYKRDEIWSQVRYQDMFDAGDGCVGSIDDEWEVYRERFGLPYFNVFR